MAEVASIDKVSMQVNATMMDEVLDEYGGDPTNLILILQKAQDIYGYLPYEVLELISERTGQGMAKIMGIVTFYSFFKLKPAGKYEIMLCQGTACHVNGADNIRMAISQELGIENGETTEDGIFTLHEVACLGCCSLAPVMMINGETYGHLTPDSAIQILRQLKAIELGEGMRILVGEGSCGVAAGAARLEGVLRGHMTSTDSFTVAKTGCIGMCFLEPIVDIYDGDKLLHRLVNVKTTDALDIINAVRSKSFKRIERLEIEPQDAHFLEQQERVALRNCGVIDPTDINDFINHGGYKAIAKALTMTPEEVIEEMKVSGLGGRGGAGFPTWFKWNSARSSKGDVKYMICNADEGDPGAFMDRAVIEGDPHTLIEGMLIGAYAIGASHAFVYVRAEYPLAVERLRMAIEQARDHGFLGENILGSDFSCDISVKIGAGAFVCGEETALMASMEGERGMPRLKPPFPAQKGYLGKPSNINNVETYANVPWIINNGGEAFAAMGTENSKGTKVFALTGKVEHGGLVEVPMGRTLRNVIFDIAGGIKNGHKFKAVQMGGPSGGCIPAELEDTVIDYKALTATGAIMGSGGMVVMDDSTCMVNMARFFLNFTTNESCGKCVPCRIGTKRMLEILDRICEGNGREGDIELLEELCYAIKDGAMCGLGQTAPNPVLTTIKYFRDEYEAHIKEHRCPALECQALLTVEIDPEKCTGCTLCAKKCPVQAISGIRGGAHSIDQNKCIKCKQCVNLCHFDAISVR
ncbi:MAG: NADH-quinone oxidoreductase subunit NuoF [Coriobacteriales bacterium]|jgi:NADH-quinone oxidoreductase subunit F